MKLKELTNNQKRKEFLEDYTGWDIWLDVPDVSERYYEYPLPDGSMIVIKETEHTKGDDWWKKGRTRRILRYNGILSAERQLEAFCGL